MTTLTSFSCRIPHQPGLDDRQPTAGARTGRLVRIDSEGRLFVDFEGNPRVPVAAKLAVSKTEIADLINAGEGTELLLVFENNDIAKPIIVGTVRDCLPSDGIVISIRGRRFIVDADEEIELRCGEAKVRITRDGKVIVLGNDVLSRARRRNRIKGGTVNIN
jgi:uncharacterized protein DUF6484